VANEKQVEMLRAGVEVWNGWRQQHPEVSPDLVKAYLSGADLSTANLAEANLLDANLSGVNLSEANLRRANLGWADLTVANLSESDLTGANLNGADLRNADLTGANLNGADLTRARLRKANLTEANLFKANLSETNLVNADVTASVFGETVFASVSLSNVHGLSHVRHGGPSFISVDTLETAAADLAKDSSRQHEVEWFLEKAGVPKEYIELFRSRVGQPIQFYSCFISYSTKDHVFADRLYADLRQKGVRCWLATEDLKIGEKFRTRINEAIRLHDKLIVVLSEQSVKSTWVEEEVETAFEKERKSGGTVLFPIRLDDAVMECNEAWAASVRRIRHIGDFRRWKDYDEYAKCLDRLIRDLRQEDTSKTASAPE
jgi:hypothetical protein